MNNNAIGYFPDIPQSHASDAEWVSWANAWPTLAPLGLKCTALRVGEAVFEVAGDPFVPNPNGAVNGGAVAAMADQAMGVVGARSCEPGTLPRTGSLHLQFHRPVRAPFTMVVSQLPGGRRVQFIEVLFRDAEGIRCASAQGTMVVAGSAGVAST
nr:PaaI family thioesterase [Rhodococcus wratislaviensis]GLK41096.1 hypothetical protein GCM10017611_79710 [Rhodococcus wratislaviensis]